MDNPKFVLTKSPKDAQFYFRLQAENGESILASQGYNAKDGAEKGIASVKTNAPDEGRFERKTSTAGEPYFVLSAANGEVLGKSQMYSSEAARETGIASVKGNAPGAPTDDSE